MRLRPAVAVLLSLSAPALAATPFPAPNHAMRFGYYYADGRYGDKTAEVFPYTDLYLAWASAYPGGTDWRPQLRASLANAHAKGKKIYLGNNLDTQEPTWLSTWGEIIDIAAPYWSSVVLLELADEPGWSQAETQARVGQIRIALSNRGLPHRPEGIVYTQRQVLEEDALFAPRLKWIGIEAYVNAPGDPDPQVNAARLDAFLDQAKARIPSAKGIVMVMQAYDRNFNWKDMRTLAAIQDPAYLKAYDDPRVLALTMFSYARPGGTRDHPELKARHLLMAEALGLYNPDANPPTVSIAAPASGASVSGTVPVSALAADASGVASVRFRLDGRELGAPDTDAPYGIAWDTTRAANGPHALIAIARDAAGNEAQASVGVTVANPVAPGPPGAPALEALDAGRLRLSWPPSPGPGLAGYRIEVALDAAFSALTWHGSRDVGLSTWAVAGGLSPGARYFARARAYGANGLTSGPGPAAEWVLPQPPAGASAAPIGVSGGSATHPSGRARVVVGPGALAQPETLILEPLPLAQLPSLGSRVAAGQAMRFGPPGLRFSGSVTLSLSHDSDRGPAIFHFDPAAGWRRLEGSVDPVARVVTARIDHFSVYAVLYEPPGRAAKELAVLEAYAYPNPARGGERPTIRVDTAGGAERVRVRVYNLAGEAVDAFDLEALPPERDRQGFASRWRADGAGSGVYRFVAQASRGAQAAVKAGRLALVR